MTEIDPENKKMKEDGEVGVPFKNSVWLLQWISNRIKKNRNLIALFIGDTGSGKSLASIRLAERVDPNFSIDRIVFTVKEFLILVNSDLPPGSVIVFDDAGLGINARLWQETSARVFGMLTQGFRFKQILTFITVPDETFIERQSRKLVHIRFESTDVQGLMKMKLLSRNTWDPEHPMAKFPRIHRGRSEIMVKMVKFRLPSDDIWEKYEAKKKAYMESRFKEFQEDLEKIEKKNNPEGKEKQGIHIHCDKCGYEWDYAGSRAMARCPSCEHRVRLNQSKDGTPEREIDPLDPMNTPVRMDMTKEEIFDLMLEKMIKTDTKITPNMRKVMEHISELTVEEIRKKGIKKGDWKTDQEGGK